MAGRDCRANEGRRLGRLSLHDITKTSYDTGMVDIREKLKEVRLRPSGNRLGEIHYVMKQQIIEGMET